MKNWWEMCGGYKRYCSCFGAPDTGSMPLRWSYPEGA